MTTDAHIHGHQRHRIAVNACIVASPRHVEPVRAQLMDWLGTSLQLYSHDASQPLTTLPLASANLIVVEVDPQVASSIDRIVALRDTRPDVVAIAAMERPDVATVRTLLRHGVTDILSLPFSADELVTAVIEQSSLHVSAEAALAPMTAVAHCSGGMGGTTVATHLAAALVRAAPGARCCVVDLDLQFGDVAAVFGKESATSVTDLVAAHDRLDSDMVRNAAIDVGQGVHVLSAPDFVTPPEGVNTDRLLHLLTVVRQTFDHVLLDLPTQWNQWTLSAACSSDQLMLVVDQSLSAMRRARKILALFDSVDFPQSRVRLIVNRAEKRMFQAISTDDVEHALRREVVAALPLHKGGLGLLQDQGVLLCERDPRAPFVRAIDGLAETVLSKSDRAKGDRP